MAEAMNSLGLAKPAARCRVVVAMSGGVDSSVTAALLVDEGFEVVGITLQLYDHGAAAGRKGHPSSNPPHCPPGSGFRTSIS